VDGEHDLTVAVARARFFRDNGFPADGGYDDEFAEAEFGLVRYRVPGSKARGDALRVHDLHHLATGYPTDWRGEAQISGWELGSGLGFTHPYAWVTALFGLFTGILGNFLPTFHAFARGRRAQNLYGERFDPGWLEMPLQALRERLGASEPPQQSRLGDALAFTAWSAVALAFGVIALPFVVLMVLDASARRLSTTCPFAAMRCSTRGP
jgi:hypothetical protein